MPLTSGDLDYVREFVRSASAIVLDNKDYLIEARLATLAMADGHESLINLMIALREERGDRPLHRKVVDALTTNETSFFRDMHPFEAIRKTILPELIERNRARKTLRIWSAACSAGQEPLSLAMTIAQHFPETGDWQVQILATDLSDEMLAHARAGRYSQIEVNRGLPAPMLVRFFEERAGGWQVSSNLLRMIRYERFNLVEPWPPRAPFDLILLRNVMIYFDVTVKRDILSKMAATLNASGYLLLGAAETPAGLVEDFEIVTIGRTSVSRKKVSVRGNQV
ncbi:MAG TPA: protein-glutamate O-methyltransferase CheR [Bryobacteraceae bacterium]|nr:protein-glutamate O-methyltransferase CheR [Bryobacteraceae bacterium]